MAWRLSGILMQGEEISDESISDILYIAGNFNLSANEDKGSVFSDIFIFSDIMC